MSKPIHLMTEEELREELRKTRAERAGKGRQKRKEARTRRVSQAGKDRKVRKDAEAVDGAEWV